MKKKASADNRGVSMITVVISFALLMIFVTAFYKVQRTSQNMLMDARDLLVNNRELIESYYLSETTDTPSYEGTLTFAGEDGSFTLHASLYQAGKEEIPGVIYYYRTEEEKEQIREEAAQ